MGRGQNGQLMIIFQRHLSMIYKNSICAQSSVLSSFMKMYEKRKLLKVYKNFEHVNSQNVLINANSKLTNWSSVFW